MDERAGDARISLVAAGRPPPRNTCATDLGPAHQEERGAAGRQSPVQMGRNTRVYVQPTCLSSMATLPLPRVLAVVAAQWPGAGVDRGAGVRQRGIDTHVARACLAQHRRRDGSEPRRRVQAPFPSSPLDADSLVSSRLGTETDLSAEIDGQRLQFAVFPAEQTAAGNPRNCRTYDAVRGTKVHD